LVLIYEWLNTVCTESIHIKFSRYFNSVKHVWREGEVDSSLKSYVVDNPTIGRPVLFDTDRVLFHFISEMGNAASVKTEASASAEPPATTAPAPETKPKKKICCACPDTKKLRDDCIVQNGEDACGKFIEAHLQCLRAEGFNV
jgi:cytochrome c oxidase assembly protein subunit 17